MEERIEFLRLLFHCGLVAQKLQCSAFAVACQQPRTTACQQRIILRGKHISGLRAGSMMFSSFLSPLDLERRDIHHLLEVTPVRSIHRMMGLHL